VTGYKLSRCTFNDLVGFGINEEVATKLVMLAATGEEVKLEKEKKPAYLAAALRKQEEKRRKADAGGKRQKAVTTAKNEEDGNMDPKKGTGKVVAGIEIDGDDGDDNNATNAKGGNFKSLSSKRQGLLTPESRKRLKARVKRKREEKKLQQRKNDKQIITTEKATQDNQDGMDTENGHDTKNENYEDSIRKLVEEEMLYQRNVREQEGIFQIQQQQRQKQREQEEKKRRRMMKMRRQRFQSQHSVGVNNASDGEEETMEGQLAQEEVDRRNHNKEEDWIEPGDEFEWRKGDKCWSKMYGSWIRSEVAKVKKGYPYLRVENFLGLVTNQLIRIKRKMYNKRMSETYPGWQEEEPEEEEHLEKDVPRDKDFVGTAVSTPVSKRGRKAQLYAAAKSSKISSSSRMKKEEKKNLLRDNYMEKNAARKRKQGDRIRREEEEVIASKEDEKVRSKKRKTTSKLNTANEQRQEQLQQNREKHRKRQQSTTKPGTQKQREEEENLLDALVNTPQFKDKIIQIVKEGLRTDSTLTKRMVRSKLEKFLAIGKGVLDRRKKKINLYIAEALSENAQ